MRKSQMMSNEHDYGCYDINGNKISLEQWGGHTTDHTYKRVGYDEVNNYRVSTVWTGIDMRLGSNDEAPPVIFETMVFPKDDWSEVYQERYSTLEQAQEGHKRAVLHAESLDREAE